MTPGRSCPLHYRYAPHSLQRAPEVVADTLYVIGGLYGNLPALRAIETMAASERVPVTLVFNGDFNWFNIDAGSFASVNEGVLAHHALRGNVETELAGDDGEAGCGCAYPDSVGDEEVARSNAMLAQLRTTARGFPALRARLAALPMNLVAETGGLRVAIVHGDCESHPGWNYDVSAFSTSAGSARLAAHFAASGARIIASSHTCLPVALRQSRPQGDCALFNNGAAGMPNFAGTQFGVITRIANTPARASDALYGTVIQGVHIDALAVRYDPAQWQQDFAANWPAGSPGHLSYRQRIDNGPRHGIHKAMRKGIHLNPELLRGLRIVEAIQ